MIYFSKKKLKGLYGNILREKLYSLVIFHRSFLTRLIMSFTPNLMPSNAKAREDGAILETREILAFVETSGEGDHLKHYQTNYDPSS